MKILSGKLKPNLGNFDEDPGWKAIIQYFRGSELQNYFVRMLEEKIRAVIKLQYVDAIPMSLAKKSKKAAAKGIMAMAAGKKAGGEGGKGKGKGKGGAAAKRRARMAGLTFPTVGDVLKRLDAFGTFETVMDQLELSHVQNRDVDKLSGGELQRFAIAVTIVQDYNMYMFDEPSSYLDVKQRLRAAFVIRELVDLADKSNDRAASTYVLCVEHDLAVLDYLSDFICVLYGKPGAYGVVTNPFSVRDGINVFLAGYNPAENMRFRNFSLDFKIKQSGSDDSKTASGGDDDGGKVGGGAAEGKKRRKKKKKHDDEDDEEEDGAGKFRLAERHARGTYPKMTKTLRGKKSSFKLHIEAGRFHDSEIVVLLGENGTGKTTFIRMLAGQMKSDEEEEADKNGEDFVGLPKLAVSFKPQKITPKVSALDPSRVKRDVR